MNKPRPRFVAIQAPYTWENAIEFARKGRPDMLAMLITEESIPKEHRSAVAELLARPPASPKMPKAVYLPHDAAGIRSLYTALVAAGQAPKRARSYLAGDFGVSEDTMRDIVERKKSYRSLGEQIEKPPRKNECTTRNQYR